jgi:hypothetical protein
MDRSDFLRALAGAARGLEAALNPSARQWFVNMIATGYDTNSPDGQGPKELTSDRIFEFACYFYLVGHLCRQSDRWMMVKGDGAFGYRLPYSPGAKTRFAFFRFEFGGEFVDLCCGVEIPLPMEPDEAPDISLQEVAVWEPAQRGSGTLVGLWEGKFHGPGNSLTKSDFNQMVSRCDVLRPPRCASNDWLERICPDPFKVHALVTNAAPAARTSFNRGQQLRLRFSLVFSFAGTSTSPPTPSRADHLAHP